MSARGDFVGVPVRSDHLSPCPDCGARPTLRRCPREFPDPGSEWVRCTACARTTDLYPIGFGGAEAEWAALAGPGPE